jgi:hypothetical protein
LQGPQWAQWSAMQVDLALAQLAAHGLEADGLDALAEGFGESLSSLPEADVFFLEPGFVEAACRDAGLPPEVTEAALSAAQTIGGDSALAALAWHCHRCLYVVPGYPSALMRRWPALVGVRAVGPDTADTEGRSIAPLYLLVLLSGIGEANAVHAAHGVPQEVRRETLYDIQRWLVRRPAGTGSGAVQKEWFLPPRYLGWLRNHLRGELYHLVRLQFQFGTLWSGAVFFRHRRSGAVVALSEDGVRYRPDGDVASAEEAEREGAWTAYLRRSESEVSGYPIHPAGPAQRREVRLRMDEWEQALAPGDSVLHLHIPAGSPMDYAQCGESLRTALAFFPTHFPERPFRAFACSSWLLDRRLEERLPEASNIVRLQREVYQLPSRPDGRSALERVFGQLPVATRADAERLPRETSLRRALADLLLAGGEPRGGRCVLFPEDLNWGAQVYRGRGLGV